MLNFLSACLGWLQEQPGVLAFCKLRLHRTLIVYELVSISSKLCCLLPQLGSCSSFVSCIVFVWFSAKKKASYLKPVSELALTYICSICRGMPFPEIPFVFFPLHKDSSLTVLAKARLCSSCHDQPRCSSCPKSRLVSPVPTNLCRRWRTRNSLHSQHELEVWVEWCPCVYVQLAYPTIHTHTHAHHHRHTNMNTKSAFPHFFFCQNYYLPLESSLSTLKKTLLANLEPSVLCVFLLTKSCIFQAKLLASCTTPRANQGMVYSSVPFLPHEQMPCV